MLDTASTCDVAPGERVAVVGASGAGKSTLGVIAVAGRLHPTRGAVLIGGVHLDDLDLGERPPVAMVSQEVHVFSGTVRDDLRAGRAGRRRGRASRRRSATWARWAAVHALPEGLDTVVGDGALSLTAGARPAAGAGPGAARRSRWSRCSTRPRPRPAQRVPATWSRAAEAVTRGRTSLDHRAPAQPGRDADRILVMDAGRVVEAGSHDELVALGGSYARLWAAWSG